MKSKKKAHFTLIMNAINYFHIHYTHKCFPNENYRIHVTFNESAHFLIGKKEMSDSLLCTYRKFVLIYSIKQKGQNK